VGNGLQYYAKNCENQKWGGEKFFFAENEDTKKRAPHLVAERTD